MTEYRIVRAKPAPGDGFCVNCQRWLRHRRDCPNATVIRERVECYCTIHTCYDRGDLTDRDGNRVKCLIFAFSRRNRWLLHVAWAGGMEMTATTLCGVKEADLTIDRAKWPTGFPKRQRVCENCMRQWVKGLEYKDFV